MLNEKTLQNSYNKGDLLSVTIQPDDKLQGFNTPKRYQDFLGFYHTKLNRILEDNKLFQFYFRLELSEPIGSVQPDHGPRLHLHGFVELLTNYAVFKWLCDVMPDLLTHARLEVHHIKSAEMAQGWHEYIHAQETYMPVGAMVSNVDTTSAWTSPERRFNHDIVEAPPGGWPNHIGRGDLEEIANANNDTRESKKDPFLSKPYKKGPYKKMGGKIKIT